jgi:hypothetical protein
LREGGAPFVGSTPIVRRGSGGIFETRDRLLGGFKRGDVSIDVENLDRPADPTGGARKEEETSRPKRSLVGVLERTIPARIDVRDPDEVEDHMPPLDSPLQHILQGLSRIEAQNASRVHHHDAGNLDDLAFQLFAGAGHRKKRPHRIPLVGFLEAEESPR